MDIKIGIGLLLVMFAAAFTWLHHAKKDCCSAPPVSMGESATLRLNGALNEGGQPKSVTETAPVAKPLDLTLPVDEYTDGSQSFDTSAGRYGVKDWFKKEGKPEPKLKLKSKIYLKEDASFEEGFSTYDDTVDGVEMGFEYKTP